MTARPKVCHVYGMFRLNFEDDDNLVHQRSITELWRSLPSSLSSRSFVHEGCDVVVSMDWSPVGNHFAKQLSSYTLEMPEEDWWKIYSAELRLPANVEISGRSKFSENKWGPEYFVESYLYDLFVILNLALPGSADFLNVGVESASRDQLELIKFSQYASASLEHRERLELSAYYFESEFRKRKHWPTLRAFDPQVVATWYYRVRSGISQVPDTPVERAVFALLHVCRSSGRPEDLVWLFYAFESLFQTRVGENYSALLERLLLLLKPDNEQEKQLRKRFRAMYDYRSSFVHGGLQVIHPMHNEQIDNRIDDQYSKIVELSLYGTRLLLASLQRYIEENWSEVRYKTTIEPVND